MHTFMSRLMAIALTLFFASSNVRAEQQNIMVVLDASGSMWGQIDGVPKINIARQVMGNMLGNLSSKANIGVLTYGHRKKGDCSDIETIIPIGPVNQKQYMSVINALRPKGKTPITQAVRLAAEELRFTERKATVVLISDGLETCQADPCALAKDLEKLGVDFTVHVVGFDLKNQDTTSLQCLANETGGKYLAADDADELGSALDTVVAQTTEPEPQVVKEPEPVPVDEPTALKVDVLLAPGGQPLKSVYIYVIPEADGKNRKKAVSSGNVSRTHKVKPGKYYIEANIKKAFGSTNFEVKSGQENRAEIILNAGLLHVTAVAKEGGQPIKQAYIYIKSPTAAASGKRKSVDSSNQRNTFMLPVGKYYALATHGKAKAGQMVEVTAGQKTETTIILASGLLKISVLEQEGGEPQTRGAYVYIYEYEKQTDGSRKRVTGANPRKKFSLPAGKYYVEAQIGKAKVGKTINIVAGKLTNDSIIVGVGAFKASVIPAEGGKPLKKAYVRIYQTEKQLDGKRKLVTSANQRQTFKLPAGKYFVTAQIDKAIASQEIVITAGKLTETVLNANAGALQVIASKKVHITIYEAEKSLDGSRTIIVSLFPGKPFMLPVGKYVLIGKKSKKIIEASFEITAGKLTELPLTLE